MKNYNRQQVVASVCVTFFVVSMALVLLVLNVNKIIYSQCVRDYTAEAVVPDRVDSETLNKESGGDGSANGAIMSGVEAKLYYNQLADGFASFFKSSYKLPGYDISQENADKLNVLKRYYRAAWIIALVSFFAGIRSFVDLSRRRLFMPLLYGGVFAALLTSINGIVLLRSDSEVITAIRNMVFHGDYGYFSDGDILKSLLPAEFARWLVIGYIALVFLLILLMVLMRWFIIFRGRPHRF